MSRPNRRRPGFTLIEILIVVVILGILAAIVVPQFATAQASARATAMRAQLNTIHNLRYYQRLMDGLRSAIETGTFERFVSGFYGQRGEPVPPLTTY